MLRVVLAVAAALVVNMLVVAGCEMLLGQAYPLPPESDPTDPATLTAYVRSMPPGASAALLAGWAAGAWGASLTGWLVSARRRGMAWPGAAINFAGVTLSLYTLPHPLWVAVIGLVMPIVAGLVVPRLSPGRM